MSRRHPARVRRSQRHPLADVGTDDEGPLRGVSLPRAAALRPGVARAVATP